jgi:hypothetical protein
VETRVAIVFASNGEKRRGKVLELGRDVGEK